MSCFGIGSDNNDSDVKDTASGAGALTVVFFAGALVKGVGIAIDGVIGKAVLPLIGMDTIATAAGSFGSVFGAGLIGGALMLIPHLCLQWLITGIVDPGTFPIANWVLSTVSEFGMAIAGAAVGAAILGLAVNPVVICAVAGIVTWKLIEVSLNLLVALAGIAYGFCARCCADTSNSQEQEHGFSSYQY